MRTITVQRDIPKAYIEGLKAARAGTNIKRSDCPYLEKSRNEHDWKAGWSKGDREEKSYMMGQKAAKDGKTLASAPPHSGNISRHAWVQGWREVISDFVEHSAANHVFHIRR